MEQRWIIDQIKENTAVLETEAGENVTVPAALLPSEAKEGDVILIRVDREGTEQRKEKIRNLMEDLLK